MSDPIQQLSADLKELADKVSGLKRGFGWREILPGLSVVASILLGIWSLSLQRQSQDNHAQLETAKARIEDSNFRIAVLHEVKDAVVDPQPKRQQAVALFVKSLDSTDRESFQQAMAGILSSLSTSPEVKQIATYTVEEAQTSSANVSRGGLVGSAPLWNYDVFYCAAADKATAVKMSDALKGTPGIGRLRVRLLPAAINRLPSYGIKGYVIRRYPDKDEQARKLKQWLDPIVAPQNSFQIWDSNQKLPGYLSAFACPDGTQSASPTAAAPPSKPAG